MSFDGEMIYLTKEEESKFKEKMTQYAIYHKQKYNFRDFISQKFITQDTPRRGHLPPQSFKLPVKDKEGDLISIYYPEKQDYVELALKENGREYEEIDRYNKTDYAEILKQLEKLGAIPSNM